MKESANTLSRSIVSGDAPFILGGLMRPYRIKGFEQKRLAGFGRTFQGSLHALPILLC